jgi:nucleoid-associated protein YgaU
MASTPKTRGTIIADEIDVLQARANDTSNPAAASDALYVSSALMADPRYLAQAFDHIDSMGLSATERERLRNSTLDAHQSSKEFIAGKPNNAALKQQATAILDRAEREGVPSTPTVSATTGSPNTPQAGFLDSVQSLADKVAANPNGEDAKFALYVQSDPRFMQSTNEALQASGQPESTQASMRGIAQTLHDVSERQTRLAPPDDAMKAKVDAFYQNTAKPEAAPVQTEYTVKEGDSLSKIARDHYGLTDPKEMYEKALELARQNGIDNPDLIKPGQKLNIPNATAPESSAALDQIMSRGLDQNSDGKQCIVGTTAGGRSLDTVLSNQWTQAIGQNLGLTNFRTMEYRGPYANPDQSSSLLAGPYKLDSGNGGITGFTMAGKPLNTALGDAWALGVNGADFSRAPSLGAAPAVDTSKPGWFARSAQQSNGL